jgi:predicted amino acid racemase
MNGSALEGDRNLAGQGKGLDEVNVTNGTPCDTNVCNLHAKSIHLLLAIITIRGM